MIGIFPSSENSPRKVLGFAKYAVDTNLFRLVSSILTRAKWATNRNNVGGEHSLGEYTGMERAGGNFPGGSIPRTNFPVQQMCL